MTLRIIRWIEILTETVGGMAALLVVPLVLATCWEVFARYVLGAPTIWAFELGYMLMGVHFLLGGAITLKRQVHVRIDLIYARLTSRRRAWIDLILYSCLILPAVFLLCVRFWEYTAHAYEIGELSGQSAWNPPIWPFRAVIVFSFIVLGLQVLAECLKCVKAIRHHVTYPDT
ncbi:TRAP transporter small permease subunit [Pikeienuella sp. HZG-20]|uniref:TRAP transporter small permease subunit n=1 Tax=Paludibacillus litoralis TaxID=3133267 RepID=UPI0030EED2A5